MTHNLRSIDEPWEDQEVIIIGEKSDELDALSIQYNDGPRRNVFVKKYSYDRDNDQDNFVLFLMADYFRDGKITWHHGVHNDANYKVYCWFSDGKIFRQDRPAIVIRYDYGNFHAKIGDVRYAAWFENNKKIGSIDHNIISNEFEVIGRFPYKGTIGGETVITRHLDINLEISNPIIKFFIKQCQD